MVGEDGVDAAPDAAGYHDHRNVATAVDGAADQVASAAAGGVGGRRGQDRGVRPGPDVGGPERALVLETAFIPGDEDGRMAGPGAAVGDGPDPGAQEGVAVFVQGGLVSVGG